MNITSKEVMIFTKTDEKGKVHYKASLSNKNIKGEYENAYIDVRMPKNTEIKNKTKININKGFLSFINYKDKENKSHTIWYIVVQEYTIDEEITKIESYTTDELDEGMELPF